MTHVTIFISTAIHKINGPFNFSVVLYCLVLRNNGNLTQVNYEAATLLYNITISPFIQIVSIVSVVKI